jgi:large subunit ribosomal protein L3
VIEAAECVVTQVKTQEKEGYSSIQLGYGTIRDKLVNKPLKGHFDKVKVKPKRYLAEMRVSEKDEYQVGQVIKVDVFSVGDKADITGISKGKGYAGVIKRWGFRGGPGGHGSHFHRAPGSIGACASPSRVFKGRKLPGQMGNSRVTIQNLEIVGVDAEQDLLLVKGNVPGSKDSLVLVRESVKTNKKTKRS